MTFDFNGKTVIITGASRGIGKATAKLFAEAGANVAITYRTDRAAATRVLEQLRPGVHTTFPLDVSDPSAIERFYTSFSEKYPRLDILVNNAAVFSEHKILETGYDTWLQSWNETLSVNLVGAANMCYFGVKQMPDGGKIVNISSRGAFRGEPDHPAYGASKAGLNSMSQSLALALAPRNISVHVIAPGFVETDMAAEVLNGPAGDGIRRQSPFNRVAMPEEVARLVAVCASEGMTFSSGGIIDLNGASYLRS